MSMEYLQSLIDDASTVLDRAPQDHPLVRSARSQLWMAQSMLDRGLISDDGTKDKSVHFAWRAHIRNAINAYQMAMAEPRLDRDTKRQEGPRKGRNEWVDDWLEQQLCDDPRASNKLLNRNFEEHCQSIGIEPPIGLSRLSKRATRARKRLNNAASN